MKVDWEFVSRIARLVSGDTPGHMPPARLQERADDAAQRVIAATGLTPSGELPPVEWVSRSGWAEANLVTMRGMLEPVIERAPTPKGASPLIEPLASGTIALEIGGLIAMLARRVLGQFEVNLLDPERPGRLLLVAPNLQQSIERMEVPREDFITWVLLHEMTHAVQFTAVPWLRVELGAALRELLKLAEMKPDPRALLKLRGEELRETMRAIREGGLIGAVVGPEKRALIARVQGIMGLVEGHAEWTMDRAGAGAIDDVERLRSAMTRRRGERAPLLKLLDRLLGFDLKLRQYEQGKQFCDRVDAERGVDGLLLAFSAPQLAPTMAELGDPDAWLRRTGGMALPAAG